MQKPTVFKMYSREGEKEEPEKTPLISQLSLSVFP